MTWPFRKHPDERDHRVTALEEQARVGEISLIHSILELDRKRVDVTKLAEEALRNLHDGARRV